MIVNSGDESVAVAGDGTILRGLDVGEAAGGCRRSRSARSRPGRSSAASRSPSPPSRARRPASCCGLIEKIEYDDEGGVEATMRGDIPIQFGPAAAAAEKWAAAAAVLADPRLDTLTYVDVRVAERPAVGGAGPAPEEAEATAETPETPIVPETATPDQAVLVRARRAPQPESWHSEPNPQARSRGLARCRIPCRWSSWSLTPFR